MYYDSSFILTWISLSFMSVEINKSCNNLHRPYPRSCPISKPSWVPPLQIPLPTWSPTFFICHWQCLPSSLSCNWADEKRLWPPYQQRFGHRHKALFPFQLGSPWLPVSSFIGRWRSHQWWSLHHRCKDAGSFSVFW